MPPRKRKGKVTTVARTTKRISTSLNEGEQANGQGATIAVAVTTVATTVTEPAAAAGEPEAVVSAPAARGLLAASPAAETPTRASGPGSRSGTPSRGRGSASRPPARASLGIAGDADSPVSDVTEPPSDLKAAAPAAGATAPKVKSESTGVKKEKEEPGMSAAEAAARAAAPSVDLTEPGATGPGPKPPASGGESKAAASPTPKAALATPEAKAPAPRRGAKPKQPATRAGRAAVARGANSKAAGANSKATPTKSGPTSVKGNGVASAPTAAGGIDIKVSPPSTPVAAKATPQPRKRAATAAAASSPAESQPKQPKQPKQRKTAAATASVPLSSKAPTSQAASKKSAETKQAAKSAGATAAAASSKSKKRAPIRPECDEIWKKVYLAGTEWSQLEQVYSIDWDFDHLDDALNDGDLSGRRVYLFGATEPQLVRRDAKDLKGEVVPIPVIVAVVSDVAPPSMVGIKSVQKTEEEIVPMSDLRIEWLPYAPINVAMKRSFTPQVFYLGCIQRRARLRNMEDKAVHRYDYVLPYYFDPDKQEDIEEETEVEVMVDLEDVQAPLMCAYDYELDDLEEFVTDKLKERELDVSKYSNTLRKAVQEAVKKAKLRHKNEKEERQKKLEAITPAERAAYRNTKLIKFYPMNEWPDISSWKGNFINRYYGKASEIRDDFLEE